MKKQLFRAAVLAVWTAAAVSLTACGGGSSSAMAVREDVKAENAAAETMAAPYDIYDEAGPMAEEAGADAGGGSGRGGEQQTELPTGRKLIRTIDMDVETDGFDSLLSHIGTRIKELGGYVEESNTSGRRASRQNEQVPRSAYLTARIPSDKLDQFVTTVEENGNVVNKSENTQDVTLKYSDLESRKKSLTIEQERIWELLEKADTLEAVITLEERLSEIRYSLESMESQLRLYDNQVDYSTVTLRINEVTVFTPTAPETVWQRIGSSFSRNMNAAVTAVTNLFIAVVAGSPIWFPVLIALLLVLYLARKSAHKKGPAIDRKTLKDRLKKKKQDP